jgi:bacteriocin biosynthesis cyclodehydratase domain-containing protein
MAARRPPLPDRILHPAARALWRPDSTLQLELGDRAVIVPADGVDAVRPVLGHHRQPAPAPSAAPPAPGSRHDVVQELTEAGYLWPADDAGVLAPSGPDGASPRLSPPRPHLAGELRAMTVRHGEQAAELLHARRHVVVVVQGDNRAGPLVASLLGAAGVGHVYLSDAKPVRMHQCLPGGIGPQDEGRSFGAAAAAAVQRAAPQTNVRCPPAHESPDLVVLAYDEPIDPDHRAALHAHGHAHLPVRLAPDHGVVGPLVIPGLTSCLRCADLHRLDRDPAWTALAVQLSTPPRTGSASPVTLAATLAAVAAGQALAYLDGEQPATIDGTVEQHLPDWRLRRRSWPVHPDCDCCRDAAFGRMGG